MDQGADAPLAQVRLELVAITMPYDEQMPDRTAPGWNGREKQLSDTVQPSEIMLRQFPSSVVPLVEFP